MGNGKNWIHGHQNKVNASLTSKDIIALRGRPEFKNNRSIKMLGAVVTMIVW
jgi:hypothetical protein